MIHPDYVTTMAAYNRWMNGRLYDCAARLTDEQRKQDRGAFFKSLHGTLDHLLYADTLWLDRFMGRPRIRHDGRSFMFDEFAALKARREQLDDNMQIWAQHVESLWLGSKLTYFSGSANREFTLPVELLVIHFFNHQTHHRGQATTLLMQMGIDPEVTDLPAMI